MKTIAICVTGTIICALILIIGYMKYLPHHMAIITIIFFIIFIVLGLSAILDERDNNRRVEENKIHSEHQIAKSYDPAWDNDFSSSDAEI